MSPNYMHDCNACQFIKNITVEGVDYDVYRCPGGPWVSWIARYGDYGDDYWSMPWDVLRTIDPTEVSTPLLDAMYEIAMAYEEAHE